MNSIIETLKILAPFMIVSWTIFLFSAYRHPYKFRNVFYFMIALFFTVFFISGFFGENMSYVLLAFFLAGMLFLFLVPGILMMNGIVMIKKESFALSHILSFLLGIFVLVGEIATIITVLKVGFSFKYYNLTFFIGASVFYFSFILLAFVIYLAGMTVLPHRYNYNYIIIHGCGLIQGNRISKLLSNRCDAAIQAFHKGKDQAILIPSGGKGADEDLSEAEAMKQYLLEKGIPEDHILMEDKSTTTMENLINSRSLIYSRTGKKKIALVTSNYHVYRCLMYASSLGLKCSGIGAKVALYYLPCAIIREFVAIFTRKKYLIYIIGGYSLLILIPFIYIITK